MNCPKCSAYVADDASFCPQCGQSLSAPMFGSQPSFCGMCGSPVMPGQKFCGNCSAPIGLAQPPSGLNNTQYVDLGRSFDPDVHEGVFLTVFEGNRKMFETSLTEFGKNEVTFGSSLKNDLIITSSARLIADFHGRFLIDGKKVAINDCSGSGSMRVNGEVKPSAVVSPGDVITIGEYGQPWPITMLLSYDLANWRTVDLSHYDSFTIGRGNGNDLVIPTPSISVDHALLQRNPQTRQWGIIDRNSFNGTYVNGSTANVFTALNQGDTVFLANVHVIFLGEVLLVNTERGGVDVSCSHLVMIRKQKGKKRVTTDDVSLHINPGRFVAIIGGSGSGKSTLLNELNGTDPATHGRVFVNGVDLYANYGTLKNAIGYVPQQDIVYDNLRVVEALRYSAELRMPPDSTKEERETRVDEVISMLELDKERDNFIGRLSGGQKKRASIAVELLADPRLLFLDEPTSGLDPGIEGNLMRKLQTMAHEGRTIILVTHTTTNLHLCDKIIFMGPGGKLCYEGDPSGALTFFDTDDYAQIYGMVDKDAATWSQKFVEMRLTNPEKSASASGQQLESGHTASFGKQLSTLTRRYAKLVINDRARLALLLLQAPVLAALICLVTGDGCFSIYEDTKSCLFAIACAAFWVGILNAIQEICKEDDIYQREYAGGLNIVAYVFSKVIVLGVLCIIQSAMLAGVFCAINGVPEYPSGTSPLINPALEIFITVLLTTLSAMCLGLLVSALFRNPDRAIAMAPILIMPQILFSGLIFELKGAAEAISVFVNCRWSMEAFGTTANLNSLDYSLVGDEVDLSGVELNNIEVETPATTVDTTVDTALGSQNVTVDVPADTTVVDSIQIPDGTKQTLTSDMYPHDLEDAFTFSLPHLFADWGILALFCIVCIAGCCLLLKSRARR